LKLEEFLSSFDLNLIWIILDMEMYSTGREEPQ
jgi:hypothetical protein